MRRILTFSGGKDSLATICWAKDNLEDFEVVFCDTGWENEKTYEHLKYVEDFMGKKIVHLKSDKFVDLIDLFVQKKRPASTKSRFCTEEMKSKPMIDYVLSIKDDVVIYQGVRAEESESRSKLSADDEYFKFYEEPYGYDKKGSPKTHSYRKKEVISHLASYSVDVKRPILKWTAAEVFEFIFAHGLKPNPLYYEGFSRVGCFPCIMARMDEMKLIAENYPDRIAEIRKFEEDLGRTFFPADYIPARFCSRKIITKKGKVMLVPTIDDVVRYVTDDANQMRLFDKQPGCISVYNICESGQ